MNANICAGLRRMSLVRSAALRSGLARISAIRSGDSFAALDGDWAVASTAARSQRDQQAGHCGHAEPRQRHAGIIAGVHGIPRLRE
jgi:hypothetical protein